MSHILNVAIKFLCIIVNAKARDDDIRVWGNKVTRNLTKSINIVRIGNVLRDGKRPRLVSVHSLKIENEPSKALPFHSPNLE
jgi:hypothetical protein